MGPVPPSVDSVLRQVRRVRWRHNFQELQRTLYLLVAVGAGAGALLLPLALRASLDLFAAGAVAIGLAAAAATVLLTWNARRRWLRGSAAPLWIDARARLSGQLATLVELHARGDAARRPFFLPLLEELNEKHLDRWRPERLLPADVPFGAFGVAAAAVAALVLALALAPWLRPSLPELVLHDGGLGPVDTGGLPIRRDGRAALPRWSAGTAGGQPGGPAALALPGDEADTRASAVARLASGLQERVRERLWGESWTRMREALARGPGARPAGVRSGAGADRARGRERARAGLAARSRAAPPERAEGDGDSTDTRPGAAPGAGSGSDPDLLGPARAAGGADDDTFELAITARVRAERPAGQRPSGPPPASATDLRPSLATRQRREAAIHRAVVPPAYEDIVRSLFARETRP